jgi:hypothetical protein
VSKQAISVTLDSANLMWLRARAGATGARSVSALLDRLIADARGKGVFTPHQSVVGTVDIDSSDPLLLRADAAVASLVQRSLARPVAAEEGRAASRSRKDRTGRRG